MLGHLERCALTCGNAHSADGWKVVLKSAMTRYSDSNLMRFFRGDVAKAMRRALVSEDVVLKPLGSCANHGTADPYACSIRKMAAKSTGRRSTWGQPSESNIIGGNNERLFFQIIS